MFTVKPSRFIKSVDTNSALHKTIAEMCGKLGIEMPRVEIHDTALGIKCHACAELDRNRVILGEGLFHAMNTTPEAEVVDKRLAGVIAHELEHIQHSKSHLRGYYALGTLPYLAMGALYLYRRAHEAVPDEHKDDTVKIMEETGNIVVEEHKKLDNSDLSQQQITWRKRLVTGSHYLLAASLGTVAAMAGYSMMSRHFEFKSDARAVSLVDKESVIEGMKIVHEHCAKELEELHKDVSPIIKAIGNTIQTLFPTHPSMEKRIAHMRAL